MLDGNGQINPKEYYKVLHKSSHPVTAQEFRMIESQRISRYSRTEEGDIPELDIFRIGSYRKVNKGSVYIVRNYGKDNFEVVVKEPIRADKDLERRDRLGQENVGRPNRRNNRTAERETSEVGRNRNGDFNSQDRGTLQENDRHLEKDTASEQRISDSENDPDSGWGHLNSLRNTEGASNRPLPANALESAAQNDIERKKLTEYKGKIETMDAEEQKLYDLRAQIKELSSDKAKADEVRKLRDEATAVANRINIYDKQLLRLEAAAPFFQSQC